MVRLSKQKSSWIQFDSKCLQVNTQAGERFTRNFATSQFARLALIFGEQYLLGFWTVPSLEATVLTALSKSSVPRWGIYSDGRRLLGVCASGRHIEPLLDLLPMLHSLRSKSIFLGVDLKMTPFFPPRYRFQASYKDVWALIPKDLDLVQDESTLLMFALDGGIIRFTKQNPCAKLDRNFFHHIKSRNVLPTKKIISIELSILRREKDLVGTRFWNRRHSGLYGTRATHDKRFHKLYLDDLRWCARAIRERWGGTEVKHRPYDPIRAAHLEIVRSYSRLGVLDLAALFNSGKISRAEYKDILSFFQYAEIITREAPSVAKEQHPGSRKWLESSPDAYMNWTRGVKLVSDELLKRSGGIRAHAGQKYPFSAVVLTRYRPLFRRVWKTYLQELTKRARLHMSIDVIVNSGIHHVMLVTERSTTIHVPASLAHRLGALPILGLLVAQILIRKIFHLTRLDPRSFVWLAMKKLESTTSGKCHHFREAILNVLQEFLWQTSLGDVYVIHALNVVTTMIAATLGGPATLLAISRFIYFYFAINHTIFLALGQ
jgi:hypothetical protein